MVVLDENPGIIPPGQCDIPGVDAYLHGDGLAQCHQSAGTHQGQIEDLARQGEPV